MKKYIANWTNGSAEFKADNLKEAKKLANFHKRMTGFKGKTEVRVKR